MIRRPVRSERARILMNAQARMDQISDGWLPFEVKIDAMFDVLLQAGRDLDRLARRQQMAELVALSVPAGSVLA